MYMSHSKRKDHTNMKQEFDKVMKNIAKNMVYGSQIGCMDGDVVPDEKEGGEGGEK